MGLYGRGLSLGHLLLTFIVVNDILKDCIEYVPGCRKTLVGHARLLRSGGDIYEIVILRRFARYHGGYMTKRSTETCGLTSSLVGGSKMPPAVIV